MAYLPGFECDIFISYAHANNDDGWVTHFHNELQRMLNGFMEGVTLWWDQKGLNSNTCFDPEIEKQVKGAAIFLALVSGRYQESNYCRKELGMFYDKAQAEEWGLSVKNQNRIFNLLLYNIDYKKWPPELAGITALKFHDDELGFPVGHSEKEFKHQLRRLAKEIVGLLETFKTTLAATAPPRVVAPAPIAATPVTQVVMSQPDDAFTVFLATTSSTLEVQQERIFNELTSKSIRVINNIPPPLAATEHEQAVRAALAASQLSVHLLSDAPGQSIFDLNHTTSDGQPLKKSYARRQVELGLECARPQLIWLPPNLDVEKVEIERHKEFLAKLEQDNHPATTRLVRAEKTELVRIILDTVEQLKRTAARPPAPSVAALLNYQRSDREEARRVEKFLEQHGVAYLSQEEMKNPELTLQVLEEQLQEVDRLIFVYGNSEPSWVVNRLRELLGIAATNYDRMPKACGIYFAPPRQKATDQQGLKLPGRGIVPVVKFDGQDIADPQAIKELLEVNGTEGSNDR